MLLTDHQLEGYSALRSMQKRMILPLLMPLEGCLLQPSAVYSPLQMKSSRHADGDAAGGVDSGADDDGA